MQNLKQIGEQYFETLKKRSKESRVYKPHQMIGLMLAEMLNDSAHKALYMKLAKLYDNEELLRIGKNLAERKDIRNKGAYFMKTLQNIKVQNSKSK